MELKRLDNPFDTNQTLSSPLAFVFSSPTPNSVHVKLELSFAVPLRNFNATQGRGQMLAEEILSRAVACLLAVQTEQKNSGVKLETLMEYMVEGSGTGFQGFIPSVEFFSLGEVVHIHLSNPLMKKPTNTHQVQPPDIKTDPKPNIPDLSTTSNQLHTLSHLATLHSANQSNINNIAKPTSPTITLVSSSPSTQLVSYDALKKQKAKQACTLCRSAKVSCDGKMPCKRCEHRQLECAYAIPKKRGRKKPNENGNTEAAVAVPSSPKKIKTDPATTPQPNVGSPTQKTPNWPLSPPSQFPSSGSPLSDADMETSLEQPDAEQLLFSGEYASFFELPRFDLKTLQDVIDFPLEVNAVEMNSNARTPDLRYKYAIPQATPLRSLSAAIALYDKVFVPLVQHPSLKENVKKTLRQISEIEKHYNILDWRDYSDYTTQFLSQFVLSNSIDSLEDPAFIWSTTGVLLFFNVAMFNLLGWKAEELYNLDPKIRHGAFHVVHPEDMKLLLDKHFSTLSNPKMDEFSVDLRILSKSLQEIRTKGFVEVKRNPAGIPVLFYCVVYKHFFKHE